MEIIGTDQSERLVGSDTADIIRGLEGHDQLAGRSGNDQIFGDAGDDVLSGGAGDDFLNGGLGNDDLHGGTGDDYLVILDDWEFTPPDNERLYGGADDDTLVLDRLFGGDVLLNGGNGNDYISISHSDDSLVTVLAGAGKDTVELLYGEAEISLGGGRDTLIVEFTYGIRSSVVTDFETGRSGDLLKLDNYLRLVANWDGESDPFASGYFRLSQSGSDTLVQVDLNGGANSFFTLLTLEGIVASDVTTANLDLLSYQEADLSFAALTRTGVQMHSDWLFDATS